MQYKKASNSVAEFIEDCIIPTMDLDYYEVVSEVFAAYKKYCDENKIPPYSSAGAFAEEFLKIQPCSKKRKRIGDKEVRVWHGIKLIDSRDGGVQG